MPLRSRRRERPRPREAGTTTTFCSRPKSAAHATLGLRSCDLARCRSSGAHHSSGERTTLRSRPAHARHLPHPSRQAEGPQAEQSAVAARKSSVHRVAPTPPASALPLTPCPACAPPQPPCPSPAHQQYRGVDPLLPPLCQAAHRAAAVDRHLRGAGAAGGETARHVGGLFACGALSKGGRHTGCKPRVCVDP